MRRSSQVRGRDNCSTNFHNLIARTVREALRGRSAPAVAVMMAMTAGVHAQTASTGNSDTSADQTKDLNEVIVVTSRRAAIESADDRKKSSESIIDTVTADDAGKLPDASIDEVLQRVPGVTITRWGDPDHFSAEGTGVQVRGLSGVAGRINGEEVFSASGGNGLSWTDIPPELMAGVDVYKAATADLIEGGTGGQIDLRTKMPFDYNRLEFQTSANEDYADFRKKTSPTGSGMITDTWETDSVGKIGVLVDLAYGKYSSRTDFMGVEPYYKTLVDGVDRYIPGGFDYGTQDYDRTRKGAYAALQWDPIENLHLTQTYFESKYQQSTVEQDVFMDTTTMTADPSDSVFDPNGGLVKSSNLFVYSPTSLGTPSGAIYGSGVTELSSYSSDTRDLSTTFKFNGGRWSLKGGFQQVDSSTSTLSYYVFPNVPFSTNGFGLDITGSAPQVSVPAATQADLSNPNDYSYGATMSYISHNVARLRAEHLDFDYDLSDSAFFRSVRAGARYADHTETDEASSYDYTALCAGYNGCNPVTFAEGRPGDYSSAPFTNFFRGEISVPGNVLLPSLAMAARANPILDHALYGDGNLTQGIGYLPGDAAVVEYKDTALYGLVRFADSVFDIPWKGNFGLRLVRSQHESQGYYIQSSGSYVDSAGVVQTLEQTNPVDLSGGRSDTQLLPSLNLELVPNAHWQTRFNYSETMDLPNVSQIQSNGQLSATTPNTAASTTAAAVNSLSGWTATFGNPDLKPVLSHNFDLSEEWYPKPGTALHVDAFHKSIDNWLEFNNVSRLWPVVYSTGTVDTLINYQTYTNSPELTTINGVELGAHTYFDMLPGPLKGLGIDSNYTFIESKNPGDVYYDINGLPHYDAPVAGLSKYNYNVAMLYDYRWWSARLAYNWRSEYLLSTNTQGTNGSYTYYSANTPSTTNCQSPAATTCQYIKISLPVYSAAYGQLDFGVTLRPSDHYYVSFQAANLTNAIVKSLEGGYPGGQYPRNSFISDRHFNLTVGYKY